MPCTSNTSPLIGLAKIGRLELLRRLFGEVVITPAVKVESVDRGKEIGAPEVAEIEKGLDEGWIKLRTLTAKERREVSGLMARANLGLGEAEALISARASDLMVILDDKEARAVAKSWRLKYTGTVMILYQALNKNLLNYDEFVEAVGELAKVIWISPAVMGEIITRAKEVRK